MIIFQEKNDHTIWNRRVSEGFVVVIQSKAWMDEVYFDDQGDWIPHIKKKGGEESILCHDSF